MIVKLITRTKETTWKGSQKVFFGGFNERDSNRLRWLVDWQEAIWFDEESNLEPLLKRLHMISGLDLKIDYIDYTP